MNFAPEIVNVVKVGVTLVLQIVCGIHIKLMGCRTANVCRWHGGLIQLARFVVSGVFT